MKAIAAADEIAGDFAVLVGLNETDDRPVAIDALDTDIGDVKADIAADRQPGGDQVFDQLVLAVDGDGAAAGQLGQVDAMAAAGKAQLDTVMNKAFAMQPVAESSRSAPEPSV